MFQKINQFFVPEAYTHEQEQFRKAKLTVGAYFIVACFNVNYILTSMLIHYKGGLYSQIPLLIISTLCLILYKNKIAPYIVNTLFFIFAILSIAITVYFTNGYNSFILPWIASTPIVALLVAGKRGGYLALIACCISLSFFYILFLQGHNFTEDYDLEYKNVFSYTTHLGLILILFAVAMVFENAKNTALKNLDDRNEQLAIEKKRSDDLLLNILPSEIVTELKETGKSKAKLFDHVSVIFTDFVNFTKISETLSPDELVSEIDYCFKGIDEIIERNGLEKIKTIGDAYLAVCGLPNEDVNHGIRTVQAGLEILSFIDSRKHNGGKFEIRIGIHSGSLVAGIVGIKKFAYDIWGDTVNTASRLESSGEAGKVNISDSTHQLVKENYHCVYRGKIEAKNKGNIDMYFVDKKIDKISQ